MTKLKKSVSVPLSKSAGGMFPKRLRSSSMGERPLAETVHVADDVVFRYLHALAAEAARDAKTSFHMSIPPTLLAESCHENQVAAPFKWNECVLGKLLGSGEFSDVFEVQSFSVEEDPVEPLTEDWAFEEMDQRLHIKRREQCPKTKKARYALKHIKPTHLDTYQGRMKYVQAASDLATEQEFLLNLSHPNIIKIRGVADSGPTGFALVIDRLVETLDDRMRRWRNPTKFKRSRMLSLTRSMSMLSASFTNKEKIGPHEQNPNREMDHRLSIAFQIAAALSYLHSHNVIFRDLKPTNVGFDVRGDAKIFDFGLARFCPEEGDPNTEAFDMSHAGSPRYMAPELLRRAPYNMKADVYSFSIVLWEILSDRTPYAFIKGRQDLVRHVVRFNERPDIDPSWPVGIQSLLTSCFDADIAHRPGMKQVYGSLREVLVSLRQGNMHGLDDAHVHRRRSIVSVDGDPSEEELVAAVHHRD